MTEARQKRPLTRSEKDREEETLRSEAKRFVPPKWARNVTAKSEKARIQKMMFKSFLCLHQQVWQLLAHSQREEKERQETQARQVSVSSETRQPRERRADILKASSAAPVTANGRRRVTADSVRSPQLQGGGRTGKQMERGDENLERMCKK